MAKSMNGQSSLFDLTTSEGSCSVTSSRALGDGVRDFGSPVGATSGRAGRGVVHASRGRTRGTALRPPIRAIFGLPGSASYRSAALGASLVNRLRARTEGRGSTLFVMTWKRVATPSGRLIFRLAARARHFAGRASGSLPTPVARDYRNGLHSKEALERRKLHPRGVNLNEYMERTLGHGGTLNPRFVCLLMGYQTSVDDCGATVIPSRRTTRRK